MPIARRLASAAALASILIACDRSERTADASKLVANYINADTIGDVEFADSLVAPCDSAPAPEPLQVIQSVDLSSPAEDGGAVIIVARFEAIGTAHAENAEKVGNLNWRFMYAPHVDTITFRVTRDPAGRWWIACGGFRPDHRTLSQLQAEINSMDSASHEALARAK